MWMIHLGVDKFQRENISSYGGSFLTGHRMVRTCR